MATYVKELKSSIAETFFDEYDVIANGRVFRVERISLNMWFISTEVEDDQEALDLYYKILDSVREVNVLLPKNGHGHILQFVITKEELHKSF